MTNSALISMVLLAAVLVGCDGSNKAGVSLLCEAQQQPWRGEKLLGSEITTERYVVYTTTNTRDLIKYLPGFMEAAYQNYLSLTDLDDRPLNRRMPIYMMGTRDEWQALTERVTGPQAAIYTSISAGGYCYDGVGVFWDMGGLGTLAVSAHEGLHQFLHHRLRDQLPMWLEEGLCVAAEGYQIQGERVLFTHNINPIRYNDLRSALIQPGRWVPIDRLLSMDAGDVVSPNPMPAVAYYGQLWALAMFLRSDPAYSGRLAQMINDADLGMFHRVLNVPAEALAPIRRTRMYNRQYSEALFRAYISDDLETFERQYRQFAATLAGLDQ